MGFSNFFQKCHLTNSSTQFLNSLIFGGKILISLTFGRKFSTSLTIVRKFIISLTIGEKFVVSLTFGGNFLTFLSFLGEIYNFLDFWKTFLNFTEYWRNILNFLDFRGGNCFFSWLYQIFQNTWNTNYSINTLYQVSLSPTLEITWILTRCTMFPARLSASTAMEWGMSTRSTSFTFRMTSLTLEWRHRVNKRLVWN